MTEKEVILVTGANGLLGRRIIERLALTNDVYGLVHTMPKNPVPRIRYLPVDFSGIWDVNILPKNVHAIVHLAQSANFREVPEKSLDVFNVNVASTAKLLDYAWRVGVKKFIHASSGGVYGSGADAFHENSPIIPAGNLGYYLGSKLCGEVLTQSYANLMCVSVLRFFFIYGAGQNRAMLIPRLADKIKAGQPILLDGEDGVRINPIHVSDAAAAVVAVLKTDQSVTYNIAGNEVVTLKQLCLKLELLIGRLAIFTNSLEQAKDICADVSAMRSGLHKPIITLDEGLKEIL